MLAAGTTLGVYKILAPLGAGGMGEVYRAHDPRLERDIALKVLPDSLTADATARGRLIREARSAAALSHPNICMVHEVGEADGHIYIAMELVDGEPLSERIGGQPLPVESVIRYGAQIAEALAHAHERHVIHRDLKSGNVMVTADGRVKVLDFGLAKRVWEVDEAAPTQPRVTLTETGAVVGTPHYLAPEVLRGAKADAVSDVWALGVVLYEMTSGTLPFRGETTYELSAAILNETAAPLPERVPAGLRAVIAECLAKQPGERSQRAGEVRAALEALRSDGRRVPRRRWLVPAAIACVLAAVAAGVLLIQPGPEIGPAIRKQLTFTGKAYEAALSPDGQYVAYVNSDPRGDDRILVQDLSGGQPLEVFHEKDCENLMWSPNGSEIMFLASHDSISTTYVLPRLGGTPRPMEMEWYRCWSPDGSTTAGAWMPSKRIKFRIMSSGDTSSIGLSGDFTWLTGIDWSPRGQLLLFSTQGEDGYSIWTIRRDGSRQLRTYRDSVTIGSPSWSPNGNAIYFLRAQGEGDALMRLDVSGDGQTARGSPRPLLTDLQTGSGFTVSEDGKRLILPLTSSSSNLWLTSLASKSQTSVQTRQLTTGTSLIDGVSFSPAGDKIAFVMRRGNTANVHTLALESGEQKQLTFLDAYCRSTAWSPEGREIAFVSSGATESVGSVWKLAAEGGTPRRFERTRASWGLTWAPGRDILYQRSGNRNFSVLDPTSGAEKPLVRNDSVGWMFSPKYSPDCTRVAIHWNRPPNNYGAWVVSLADTSQSRLGPRNAQQMPIGWSHDGEWLYAWDVALKPSAIVKISVPDGAIERVATLPFDDVWGTSMAADARRFVCIVGEARSDIWLVENFDPKVK